MRKPPRTPPRTPPTAPLDATDFAAAARTVWAEYLAFLAHVGDAGEAESKDFAGRHAAARSALGHLEHLLKLASEHGQSDAAEDIRCLTRRARQEIADLPPEDPPDDDAA